MSAFLYNPDLLAAKDLIAGFVARGDLLALLVEDLKGRQAQHHLIIGQRGMGKTTLLRRLALEVSRDPLLSERWLALTFPEEQYNISQPSDLWLNCLDALADALEKNGADVEATDLDAFIQALPSAEEARATAALDRLRAYTHEKKGLVLCIDNADQVFGRLKADQWTIREVLGAEDRLVFVGASVAEVESAFSYGAAFYDFFQVHWLKGLTVDETREVVRALATRNGDDAVVRGLEANTARLRAMHVLTGGNPRTVVLLYQVLALDPEADVKRQLEALLDNVTPLYKARFEALPDQQQVVLGALAAAWDPQAAADVAEAARLEVTTVSTQLHRLTQHGIVEKVELPDAARLGFQVSERFFNVWYLMRASRRQRIRLMSLARCLEVLYGVEELDTIRAIRRAVDPGSSDSTLGVAYVFTGVVGMPSSAFASRLITSDDSGTRIACRQVSTLVHRDPADALRFWHRGTQNEDPLAHMNTLLKLLRNLILAGHLPEALSLVDTPDLRERARPLYAAMTATAAKDPNRLRAFAPEVAGPARDLLDALWPEAERPVPPPRKKRR